MSRRSDAEAAANAASEAARTLQARQQAVRQERAAEPAVEPAPEQDTTVDRMEPERVEKLLKARPHVQSIEEIAAKRGMVDQEEPAPAPKAEEPAPATVEQPALEAAAEPEAPKTVKVKVDGEEFDVPEAEVTEAGGLKSYQMQKASENRLKKATEAANQARASQEQMAKLLQAHTASQQPQAPKQSDQEFIAAKLDAVRFGTPQESAQAFQEVIQRLTPKPLDQQAVIAQATNQMRHDQAVSQFDSEFADVSKNPMALKLAIALRGERLAALDKGAQVDWPTFYRTIGTDVRNAFGLRPSQPTKQTDTTAGTPSQPSEKEARKASIVNLPTASARAALPKEEKELSPEEERKAAISAMKKARGQG